MIGSSVLRWWAARALLSCLSFVLLSPLSPAQPHSCLVRPRALVRSLSQTLSTSGSLPVSSLHFTPLRRGSPSPSPSLSLSSSLVLVSCVIGLA